MIKDPISMVEKDFSSRAREYNIKPGLIYDTGKVNWSGKNNSIFINNSEIMNTVNVKKDDLIKVLTENRDKHQTEYNEAYKGYTLMAVDAIEAKLKLIRGKKSFDMQFNDLNSAPESHVEDYQNVIDMLGVTLDTDIQISMDDYLKYYKNNWSWRYHWGLSNKGYVDYFFASKNDEKS